MFQLLKGMMLRVVCAVALTAAAAADVPTLTLRNGVKMPVLAAGVYQYSVDEAYASISAALKVGFTMVDTALDCAAIKVLNPFCALACLPDSPLCWTRRLEPGGRGESPP